MNYSSVSVVESLFQVQSLTSYTLRDQFLFRLVEESKPNPVMLAQYIVVVRVRLPFRWRTAAHLFQVTTLLAMLPKVKVLSSIVRIVQTSSMNIKD